MLTLLLPGALVVGQTRGAVYHKPPVRLDARAPRVGNIGNLPEVSKTVSCGFYFQLPRRGQSDSDRYVFVSQVDGRDAWMNLGGRDVRLRQIKSASRAARSTRSFNYLHGGLRVSVLFEELKPGEPLAEADFTFRLRITLRRGRAARTVRAVGYADC